LEFEFGLWLRKANLANQEICFFSDWCRYSNVVCCHFDQTETDEKSISDWNNFDTLANSAQQRYPSIFFRPGIWPPRYRKFGFSFQWFPKSKSYYRLCAKLFRKKPYLSFLRKSYPKSCPPKQSTLRMIGTDLMCNVMAGFFREIKIQSSYRFWLRTHFYGSGKHGEVTWFVEYVPGHQTALNLFFQYLQNSGSCAESAWVCDRKKKYGSGLQLEYLWLQAALITGMIKTNGYRAQLDFG